MGLLIMQEDIDSIQLACRLGDIELLSKALETNPGVINQLDDQMGWTPVYRAVICEQPAVVSFLLAHGADANLPTRVGEYPLHQAAESNQPEIAEALLLHKAAVDVQQHCTDHLDGETALHIAAGKGYTQLVDVLLRHGANPNLTDEVYSRTPLHLATIHSSPALIADKLIRAGASVTASDSVTTT